jgi:hypothetical protein
MISQAWELENNTIPFYSIIAMEVCKTKYMVYFNCKIILYVCTQVNNASSRGLGVPKVLPLRLAK